MSTPTKQVDVFDIEENPPNNNNMICARHQMGGWLTGIWNTKKQELQFNIAFNNEPWKQNEITHYINLEGVIIDD